MKRVFCMLCLCSVLTGCFTTFAAAAEGEVVPPAEEVPPAEVAAVDPGTVLDVLYWGADFVVLVKDGVEYVMDILDGDGSGTGDNIVNVDGNGKAVVTQDLITPAERPEGSLAGTMDDIFGPYQPLTYEVTTQVGDTAVVTTQVVPGLAGLDWPWLCGFSLFAICAYAIFRILGVVLK